jgi:transposase
MPKETSTIEPEPSDRRQRARQPERDAGRRPGPTTDEWKRMHELKREVKSFRRANEIFKVASAFLAGLEPRPPR